MALVQIDDLGVAYDAGMVVEGFCLSVDAGEIVVLRGENGVGKSSILRCVAGVQPATTGRVRVNGERVDESSVRFRRTVATVLDDMDFLPGLTVVEHLELIARAHGVEDARPDVLALVSELGLERQRTQDPRTLSSGQRHRLGLGTALVRPAKLYVFDEPEQRLDAAGVAWLATRLTGLVGGGSAVIMASHDAALVADLGCRTVEI